MSEFATGQPAPSRLFYQTRKRRPILDRARGIHMWTKDGRRFLDGSSGAMVCNIGHGDERVLAAMRRQMERSTFGYRLHFETEASEELAIRLCALCPRDMNRAFLVSGGSEAVESALKLARSAAVARGEGARFKVISRFPSYHGGSLGALALTGYDPLTAPYAPMMQNMPKIPAPRAWLDGLDESDAATGEHYASMLEKRILAEGPDTVLAFVEEPVGGAATGALVPPEGYPQAVRRICDRYGVLLIHDEVMSGAGRTGRFLAGEHWGTAPDIVILSKGLGAGYMPLGAMLANDDIVETVLDAGGFPHGFTYAGNPLACAAGAAVLDAMLADDMIANAERMGALLRARLEALAQRFEFIGDVRGKGLLLAFELVADRNSRQPLPATLNAFERVVELAYEEELILYSRRSRGGLEGDHVLVCPPLIVTRQGIDELVEKLTKALERFADTIPDIRP